MNKQPFPENFYFGASTSSHQVEGGCVNNWSRWEKANARRLAREARKRFAAMNAVSQGALSPKNYISGAACDHFGRFEEDFYLMKKIGLGAYRFSIEWSRVEPKKGKFNRGALDHYRKVARVAKTYKIEPFVTLWHWTVPTWFEEAGGFRNKSNLKYFLRFTRRVVEELKGDVSFWITLNEPEIFSMNSYLLGKWPPQKKGALNFYLTLQNLIRAHQLAYRAIKKISPDSRIGIAKNNTYFEAAGGRWRNRMLKKLADKCWNDYFLKKISEQQDFIGLNYYFHNRIDGWFNKNFNEKVSDLGWELYPKGIYYVLRDLKKYGKPVYITENGLADARDKYRSWFIREILACVQRAIGEGVDVKGYFHWSLLDNFEWSEGFWPRFGLIEVNYKSQERRPRKSSFEYSKILDRFRN